MSEVNETMRNLHAAPAAFSVFRGGAGVAQEVGPHVLAFGKFDGLHVGHQALLARSAQVARRDGLPFGIATFERHPYCHLRPGSEPQALTGLAQRLRMFRDAGSRFVVLFAADSAVLGLTAEDFIRGILRDRMSTRIVVVGAGFRFGRGGVGDISAIRSVGSKTGLDGVEVGTMEIAGLPVSATRVRARLAAGDIDEVHTLLGRPYQLPGRMVTADIMSATVVVAPWRAKPAPGVYPAMIRIDRGRADPPLRARVRVDRNAVGEYLFVVRWADPGMRGPPPLGRVVMAFGNGWKSRLVRRAGTVRDLTDLRTDTQDQLEDRHAHR